MLSFIGSMLGRKSAQTGWQVARIHTSVPKKPVNGEYLPLNRLLNAIENEPINGLKDHVVDRHVGKSQEDLDDRVANSSIKSASAFVLANESKIAQNDVQPLLFRGLATLLNPIINETLPLAFQYTSLGKKSRFIIDASLFQGNAKLIESDKKGQPPLIMAKHQASSDILARYSNTKGEFPITKIRLIMDIKEQISTYDLMIVTAFPIKSKIEL